MSDHVRLSSQDFQNVYEFGFTSWAALAGRSNATASHACVNDALRHQPPFPANVRLTSEHGWAYATGTSHWAGGGACDLAAFTANVKLQVTRKDPILLSLAPVEDGLPFPLGEHSYVAVLVLARAYVLSARWAQVMPVGCVQYTDSSAPCAEDAPEGAMVIGLGDASPIEARWWAAVLARGRGWQATLVLGDETFLSPWTTDLCLAQDFAIATDSRPCEALGTAPPFPRALEYLQKFCAYHDVFDQSRAALAAALLLPCFGSSPTLRLPAVRVCSESTGSTTAQTTNLRALDNMHQTAFMDKCLTLSCNARGIRSTLLSPFYEPSIECNAVTPWLQGSPAAINSIAGSDRQMLLAMMAARSPAAGWLWLGAVVLGVDGALLHQAAAGLLPVDLTSSAWSGTVHSFMQAPTARLSGRDGSVPRADECRILFLAQARQHTRFPVCPWEPFGSTPLVDAHIQVRKHVHCQDHGLRYEGFSWECIGGNAFWPPQEASASVRNERVASVASQAVSYSNMNRDDECSSENATRSIFGWLRVDGYARHEKAIWGHEWFALGSDDDDDEQETDSTSQTMENTNVWPWLSSVRADDGAVVEH
ncbi:hypothetical protein CCM_04597 [Cordyceps militaris CM01]|uniref:Uncharacterized protein n=1 Tax=Cordyceps militaris (strain CM01) TaxID=983644 RepID=G3JG95_CORMM|nr:uncharacterized protein CCM_04597 [Cordyceps militaris CM01]EGX93225.1 hypothetical protein CCM_04597 [Cordyceps militaris CM01]